MFQTAYEIAMATMCAYPSSNMHYHIGNVFYVVVSNFHRLILQVQNNIITIKTLSQSYNFMSTNT